MNKYFTLILGPDRKYRYIKDFKTYHKCNIKFMLYFNDIDEIDIMEYDGTRYFVDSTVKQKTFEEKLSECYCKEHVENLLISCL